MVTAIQRRVARLEESASGGGDGCDYCGGGDGPGDDDSIYEVVFVDPDEDLGPEFCPECGRELVKTIYFEDDPNAPWNRGNR